MRSLRELTGRNATKTAGSGALGQALHQLPGKGRAGFAVSQALAAAIPPCSAYPKVYFSFVYLIKWSRLAPAWRGDSLSRNALEHGCPARATPLRARSFPPGAGRGSP